MPRVVKVPVASFDPVARGHLSKQRRAGIRSENVKCGGRDSGLDGPVHRAGKDVIVVSVQTEDEAAVDHDSEAVEFAHHLTIVSSEVLSFAGAFEAAARKCFEPD